MMLPVYLLSLACAFLAQATQCSATSMKWLPPALSEENSTALIYPGGQSEASFEIGTALWSKKFRFDGKFIPLHLVHSVMHGNALFNYHLLNSGESELLVKKLLKALRHAGEDASASSKLETVRSTLSEILGAENIPSTEKWDKELRKAVQSLKVLSAAVSTWTMKQAIKGEPRVVLRSSIVAATRSAAKQTYKSVFSLFSSSCNAPPKQLTGGIYNNNRAVFAGAWVGRLMLIGLKQAFVLSLWTLAPGMPLISFILQLSCIVQLPTIFMASVSAIKTKVKSTAAKVRKKLNKSKTMSVAQKYSKALEEFHSVAPQLISSLYELESDDTETEGDVQFFAGLSLGVYKFSTGLAQFFESNAHWDFDKCKKVKGGMIEFEDQRDGGAPQQTTRECLKMAKQLRRFKRKLTKTVMFHLRDFEPLLTDQLLTLYHGIALTLRRTLKSPQVKGGKMEQLKMFKKGLTEEMFGGATKSTRKKVMKEMLKSSFRRMTKGITRLTLALSHKKMGYWSMVKPSRKAKQKFTQLHKKLSSSKIKYRAKKNLKMMRSIQKQHKLYLSEIGLAVSELKSGFGGVFEHFKKIIQMRNGMQSADCTDVNPKDRHRCKQKRTSDYQQTDSTLSQVIVTIFAGSLGGAITREATSTDIFLVPKNATKWVIETTHQVKDEAYLIHSVLDDAQHEIKQKARVKALRKTFGSLLEKKRTNKKMSAGELGRKICRKFSLIFQSKHYSDNLKSVQAIQQSLPGPFLRKTQYLAKLLSKTESKSGRELRQCNAETLRRSKLSITELQNYLVLLKLTVQLSSIAKGIREVEELTVLAVRRHSEILEKLIKQTHKLDSYVKHSMQLQTPKGSTYVFVANEERSEMWMQDNVNLSDKSVFGLFEPSATKKEQGTLELYSWENGRKQLITELRGTMAKAKAENEVKKEDDEMRLAIKGVAWSSKALSMWDAEMVSSYVVYAKQRFYEYKPWKTFFSKLSLQELNAKSFDARNTSATSGYINGTRKADRGIFNPGVVGEVKEGESIGFDRHPLQIFTVDALEKLASNPVFLASPANLITAAVGGLTSSIWNAYTVKRNSRVRLFRIFLSKAREHLQIVSKNEASNQTDAEDAVRWAILEVTAAVPIKNIELLNEEENSILDCVIDYMKVPQKQRWWRILLKLIKKPKKEFLAFVKKISGKMQKKIRSVYGIAKEKLEEKAPVTELLQNGLKSRPFINALRGCLPIEATTRFATLTELKTFNNLSKFLEASLAKLNKEQIESIATSVRSVPTTTAEDNEKRELLMKQRLNEYIFHHSKSETSPALENYYEAVIGWLYFADPLLGPIVNRLLGKIRESMRHLPNQNETLSSKEMVANARKHLEGENVFEEIKMLDARELKRLMEAFTFVEDVHLNHFSGKYILTELQHLKDALTRADASAERSQVVESLRRLVHFTFKSQSWGRYRKKLLAQGKVMGVVSNQILNSANNVHLPSVIDQIIAGVETVIDPLSSTEFINNSTELRITVSAAKRVRKSRLQKLLSKNKVPHADMTLESDNGCIPADVKELFPVYHSGSKTIKCEGRDCTIAIKGFAKALQIYGKLHQNPKRCLVKLESTPAQSIPLLRIWHLFKVKSAGPRSSNFRSFLQIFDALSTIEKSDVAKATNLQERIFLDMPEPTKTKMNPFLPAFTKGSIKLMQKYKAAARHSQKRVGKKSQSYKEIENFLEAKTFEYTVAGGRLIDSLMRGTEDDGNAEVLISEIDRGFIRAIIDNIEMNKNVASYINRIRFSSLFTAADSSDRSSCFSAALEELLAALNKLLNQVLWLSKNGETPAIVEMDRRKIIEEFQQSGDKIRDSIALSIEENGSLLRKYRYNPFQDALRILKDKSSAKASGKQAKKRIWLQKYKNPECRE